MKSPSTAATFSMLAPASGVSTKEPMEVPGSTALFKCRQATHGRQAHQGVERRDGLRQSNGANLHQSDMKNAHKAKRTVGKGNAKAMLAPECLAQG